MLTNIVVALLAAETVTSEITQQAFHSERITSFC